MDTNRVELGRSWSLWPLSALRSAGLPAHRVLELSGKSDGNFLSAEELARATERIAGDPWFQEALLWQNAHIVEEWLAGYDASVELRKKPSTVKAKQNSIARYLQRYATKNDTIGFFGPVGWATIDPGFPGALAQRGRGEEIRRRSFFEPWAVDTLARQWERDSELRMLLCPRVVLSGRLVDQVFFLPHGIEVGLSCAEAAVLALCDGRTPPLAIAQRLQQDFSPASRWRVADVVTLLDRLVGYGAVRWGLTPAFGEQMDERLAEQLAAVLDPSTRQRYLARLERLRDCRREVDRCAGDVPGLRKALRALAECFHELTGQAAELRKDESFDSRNLLWLDVLGDWDTTVGAEALSTLRRPLSLLLDVCRWVTWHLAAGIRQQALQLVRAAADRSVPFDAMLELLRPETTGKPGCVLEHLIGQMQAKVDALIPFDPASRRVQLSAEDVTDAWADAFTAPGPGWESARVHNPDVMLAAPSVAAANAGQYYWVLGEVHVAINPLDFRIFTLHQREPGLIEKMIEAEAPDVRYLPAFSPQWGRLTPRSYPPPAVVVPGKYVYWTIWEEDLLPADAERVPGVDLRVHADGDEPVVVDEQRGIRAPLVEFIGEFMTLLAVSAFQPFRARPHVPRITIDRLVVHRETWRIPAADLLGGLPKHEREHHVAGRLTTLGVPRFFFVRLPGEPKPIFIDLRSSPLLRNFLRLLRQEPNASGAVIVQEMLPDFGELWLADQDERRFTSEFRLIAVDERRADAHERAR